jgi:hypothetical protein
MNFIVARPAALVQGGLKPSKTNFKYMEGSNLAKVPLPSGFSMSRSINLGLRFFLTFRGDQNHAWCLRVTTNRAFETKTV